MPLTSSGRAIDLRSAKTGDQGYVTTSWARSVLDEADDPDSRDGWAKLNQQIDRMLDDKQTKLLIACEPSDPERILGWIAYAKVPGATTLLYVHVRPKERKRGIGKALLAAAGLPSSGRMAYLWPSPLCKSLQGAIRVLPEEYLA